MISTTLFALLVSAFVGAVDLAQYIPQSLEERSLVQGGGWSVLQGTCPDASSLVQCSYGCCPPGLECVSRGGYAAGGCCPKNTDCLVALSASPFCADSTWSLWSKTTEKLGAGYFCCFAGQVGLNTGGCVDGATVVAATLSASLVSAGSGPTATASQASGVGSSTALSAPATTALTVASQGTPTSPASKPGTTTSGASSQSGAASQPAAASTSAVKSWAHTIIPHAIPLVGAILFVVLAL